jgi:hypothetical protein
MVGLYVVAGLFLVSSSGLVAFQWWLAGQREVRAHAMELARLHNATEDRHVALLQAEMKGLTERINSLEWKAKKP